jgi:hypothetical protein
MKKLMSLMLGLTLLMGTTALFGDTTDTKAKSKPKPSTTAKGKKGGKKALKKTDTTSTEKKS